MLSTIQIIFNKREVFSASVDLFNNILQHNI